MRPTALAISKHYQTYTFSYILCTNYTKWTHTGKGCLSMYYSSKLTEWTFMKFSARSIVKVPE